MKIVPFSLPFDPAAACRRMFGPNGDLKVLSVALSAVFIALVHQQVVSVRHERTYPVPVSVKSENDTTAVFAFEPASAEVVLRGSQDEIAALDASRLAIEIPALNPKGAKSETLRIRASNILGTGNLKVVSVEPQSVFVRYDYMVKWDAVGRVAAPKLEGAPVQGDATVEMPTNITVVVHGSESKIAAFREKRILLPTAPVNVEGKTESFDATVAIMIPPDSGITKVEPSTIRVRVTVTTTAAAGVAEDNSPLQRVARSGTLAPEASPAGHDQAEDADSTAEFSLPPPVEIHDEAAPDAVEAQ